MPNLLLTEARERARLITVQGYDIDLDLTTGTETFESTCTITFSCTDPAGETFCDVKAVTVHEVVLNGESLDPARVQDERLVLSGLPDSNTLMVRATMRYSRDGQGLHRAKDPADGQDYVYGHLFLDAAPRVYACFDQPDLKAPYDVRVKAPEGWIVVGNGDPVDEGDGRWTCRTTKPLSTYFVSVCAGPYVTRRSTHDGIDVFLHARKSLEEHLDRHAEELFTVTAQSFDAYHSMFGIRYPFGEYHQVFVPEFNAGAMENPGCVTFRDSMIFRGAASRSQYLGRANTVAHEMAHMWFGDLVTLKWWDDLWLNESFAEYMANRVCVSATRYTDSWTDFGIGRKSWGYEAERSPSTHPVAANSPKDAQTALQNFDGISYAKGASVLRQLIAFLGDEAFLAGVTSYLHEHEYGNATLADFMSAMERASGKELGAWADAWLRTASLDTLWLETEQEDGLITKAVLHRDVPAEHPADRPHTVDVAGYTDGECIWRADGTIHEDAREIPELVGKPVAKVMVPNAGDLTWATVVLDEDSKAALAEQLPQIPDASTRMVVWNALLDGVALGTVDPLQVVDVFAAAWPKETEGSALSTLGHLIANSVVAEFVPLEQRPAALATVAAAAREAMAAWPEDSAEYLTALRVLAASSSDEDELCGFVDGEGLPQALRSDTDFRWIPIVRLAQLGLIDAGALDTSYEQDQTMSGNLNRLRGQASIPTAEAKAWAWEQVMSGERSNYEMNALCAGFWSSAPEVTKDYVARYFPDIQGLRGKVGEDALHRVVMLAYPQPFATQEVVDLAEQTLAGELSPATRRGMVDRLARTRQALASLKAFGRA